MLSSFLIEDNKTELIGNVFPVKKLYEIRKGPSNIFGLYTDNTLTTYAIKKLSQTISDESFIKFDVYSEYVDNLTVKITSVDGVEFFTSIKLKGGDFWQPIMIEINDFKDKNGISIKDYSKIIDDITEGTGADIASTSPGWAGHMAFVDPIPEFIGSGDIEEWLNQPAQIVKLHPMTIMQNSLNGTFGQSGDIANVPPCAATIGPLDVMRAKERIEVHALATCGTFSSWQRMTSRLCTHGPVTPYLPSSMLQTKKTQVYISEELAAPFECWEKVGY